MINLAIHKLRQYMEAIPVLLFCFHFVMYLLYVAHKFYGYNFLNENVYWAIQHISDYSLISLFVLWYLGHKERWGIIPMLCVYSLVCLWLNNIPSVVFGIQPEFYFFTFASIIYVTCLILSLWVLTRR